MTSIRLRILSWLLGCVTLVTIAAGWGVYRFALSDTDALFDYQLRQIALSLRDQGAAPVLADPADSYEVVAQIWNESGSLVYLSQPASGLPEQSSLGFQDVHTENGDWRVFGAQVRGRTIRVAQPMSVRRELARAHAFHTLLPVLVLLPLLAAALWFGVEHALGPMSIVTREMRARDPGLLAPLREERLPDEILPLVRALNDLLSRLAAARDAQRDFVADAAHELRSPLTALRLQMQLHDRAPDPAARGTARANLVDGIERASRAVDQLLTLARSESESEAANRARVPARLDEIAREVVGDIAPFADARGVDLGLAAADEITLTCDPDAIRTLVRNLTDNAVRYTPPGGRVDVRVLRREAQAVIEVADNGPGIPPADRERVFARFYRRHDNDEGGSGLGLAIVEAIVKRHGARIELDDAPGGGLLARVLFPAP